MREIKFKAWDSNKKVLAEVISFDFRSKMVLVSSGWIDKYKVMQFTGLFDNNDKEIYEGDIIRDASLYQWEVFYFQGVFMVRDISIPIEDRLDDCSLSYRLKKDCLIIGNIYENPKLLTKELSHDL